MDNTTDHLKKSALNDENAGFYEHIPFDVLLGFSVIGGLVTGCDVALLEAYLPSSKSILEIGAGYGRVVEHLIQKGYGDKLIALERSSQFYELLKSKFGHCTQIHHQDIRKYLPNKSFDLILWLWSGICDFSRDEQPTVLKHVFALLAPGGHLALDSMLPTSRPLNAEIHESNGITHIQGAEGYPLQVYTPSPEEIKNYADVVGASELKVIPYLTTTNRERMLYSKKIKA